MLKKIIISVIGVIVITGVLAALKISQLRAMAQAPHSQPATVVTTAKVGELTF